MVMVTGCADRPLNKLKPSGQAGGAIIIPFILLNELALLIPENEQRKVVAAKEAAELAKVCRFAELQELVMNGGVLEQHELADCYFHGQGVVCDFQKAFNLYRLAARQGCSESQSQLGICYHNGRGVRQDQVEACAWWSLVAPTHAQAQASLTFFKAEEATRQTSQGMAEFAHAVDRRVAELRQEIVQPATVKAAPSASR
jgi:TPR repeat protein